MAEHPEYIEQSAEDGDWAVLAILGPSGVGKSLAAQSIALGRGHTWMQVDDLRLAIQAIRAMSTTHSDQLSFFERTSGVWSQPVETLREAITDVARLMVPAVRIVIDSHVATDVPMVIEGDGILPDLAIDPVLRNHVHDGRVRFCCVVPESADELLENMLVRGRGIDQCTSDDKIRRAEMNLAYGQWLMTECDHCEIPVVTSRPFATLAHRIVSAVEWS